MKKRQHVIPDLIGDPETKSLDSLTPVKQAGSFTLFSPPLRGNDKNERFFILIIIVLTMVFLIPLLLSSGVPQTHDGEAHIARFAAYYKAFQDGQFPARWAGNLNFGYGTPLFIFYYPLPGYLASLLHLFGISFENSFKLLLAVSFVAAPLFFYLWMRNLFDKWVAFVGALLYGFAPYHFLNVYVRGDVAELMAFVFVPLVFYCIEKIVSFYSSSERSESRRFDLSLSSRQARTIILGSLSYALLILSHNGVSLMFSPVFLLYILFRSKTKKAFVFSASILAFGLALSAFFWLPALYEGKYTNAKLFIGDMYRDNFPTIVQLVHSPWGFGADVTKIGGLSPQIGLISLGFVLVGVGLFLFNITKVKINVIPDLIRDPVAFVLDSRLRGNDKKLLVFWLLVFFAAIGISLPVSESIWNLIPLLRLYEFPWRFVGLASFSAAVIACFVLAKFKNTYLFIGLTVMIFLSSIPFSAVERYTQKPDAFYLSFLETTYYHGEASPIWAAGDPSTPAKQQIELLSKSGEIITIKKLSHRHTFTIDAKETVTVLDNTYYFPGWKVFIDGKETSIQFQDPNYRGLITFEVSQGKHVVEVIFTESPVRMLANTISVISFSTLVLLFLTTLHYNKNKKIT